MCCAGCPDGVQCAARATERMALLFYLTGWLSTPSTGSGACNYLQHSPALQNNLLAAVKTLES